MIIIDSNKLTNTPAEDRSHAPLLASVWLRLVLHPILMLWNLCQSQYLWPNTAAVLLLTWGYENLTPVAFKKKIISSAWFYLFSKTYHYDHSTINTT